MGSSAHSHLSPWCCGNLRGICQHWCQTVAGHMVEQQISWPSLKKKKLYFNCILRFSIPYTLVGKYVRKEGAKQRECKSILSSLKCYLKCCFFFVLVCFFFVFGGLLVFIVIWHVLHPFKLAQYNDCLHFKSIHSLNSSLPVQMERSTSNCVVKTIYLKKKRFILITNHKLF